ncbi:hypothetical protein PVAG01_06936 [Phlyctema vagabunda]|uniref:Uncharacterized protein n=1 Tax=Phlyctema vagabunda TaxID=108571 RepID=A0ABR4PHL3_9HELO
MSIDGAEGFKFGQQTSEGGAAYHQDCISKLAEKLRGSLKEAYEKQNEAIDYLVTGKRIKHYPEMDQCLHVMIFCMYVEEVKRVERLREDAELAETMGYSEMTWD